MMKTKDRKKGISLIVLIITIIVVIILAAVVILTLSKNNPIESAKEARFKEDVRTFQDELAMTVSKEYTSAGGHRDTKITTSDFNEIQGYIPSFSEKYKGKFVIQDDELKYTNKVEDNEKEWLDKINVSKYALLPKEYQQVQYIESTGTQYIDTNVIPNQDTYSKAIFENVSSTIYTKAYVIGAMLKWESKMYAITPYTVFGYNSKNIQSTSFRMPNVKFTAILNKNECELLDEQKSLLKGNMTYGLFSPELSIFICANHTSDGVQEFYIGKIFNIEIKQNDLNTRNYIPCYSTTTVINVDGIQVPANTKGLYDTVEGKFYTNQGAGEDFIAGPAVD